MLMLSTIILGATGGTIFGLITIYYLQAEPDIGLQRSITLQRELGVHILRNDDEYAAIKNRHLALAIFASAIVGALVASIVTPAIAALASLSPSNKTQPLIAFCAGGAWGLFFGNSYPGRAVEAYLTRQVDEHGLKLKPLTDEQRKRFMD